MSDYLYSAAIVCIVQVSIVATTDREFRIPDSYEEMFTPTGDGSEDACIRAGYTIMSKLATLAIGVDLSEDGSKVGVRLRMAPKKNQDAEELLNATNVLRGYYEIAIHEMATAAGSNPNEGEANYFVQIVDNLRIDIDHNEGGAKEIYVRTAFDVPAFLPALIIQAVAAEQQDN